MKLNVMERLLLINMLPEKGNAVTLRIVSQLRERLSFTEADIKKYDIVAEGEQVRWNIEQAEEEAEIKIGAVAHKVIVDTLTELDTNEELELQHLSLLDKFGIGED